MTRFLKIKAIIRTGKVILYFLIIIISLTIASAQELLSLENALTIGLENSYGIKIAKNEKEIATNNAVPGNAGMLPGIAAMAIYDKSIVSAKVEHTTGLELENNHAHTDYINAGVTLKWTLFDGLTMFYAYDMLKKLEELGEMELKVVLENITADITIKYVDIVQHQLMLDVLNKQVEISKFRLQLAQIMKDVGSGSELELLQAQVDLNADESALFNLKTSLSNAKTSLNELLSRDVYLDFVVMDTIILGPRLEIVSLKQNFDNNNKDILVKRLTKEAMELELKGVKGGSYPQIDFFTNYDFLEYKTEASFVKYNRLVGPHFGLSASVKIFDGFDQRRKIQNTQISLLNADLQIEQTQNQMESYLVRLFNDYQNDLQLIEFEKRSFDLAGKNMDIAGDSYEVGMISPLQLREVQKNLLFAGYRMIRAQYRAKTKEIELLLISGQLVQ